MRTAANIMMQICLGIVTLAPAFAQEVPPPPRPSDDGPTLQETVRFIFDKLNENQKVNYIARVHNDQNGQDWNNKFSVEMTNVGTAGKSGSAGSFKSQADESFCRLSDHFRASRDDEVLQDVDAGIDLKAVREIAVLPVEQEERQLSMAAGHPELSARVDPPVFALQIKAERTNSFYFYDKTLANSVANALLHAVELCGDGQDKAPF